MLIITVERNTTKKPLGDTDFSHFLHHFQLVLDMASRLLLEITVFQNSFKCCFKDLVMEDIMTQLIEFTDKPPLMHGLAREARGEVKTPF